MNEITMYSYMWWPRHVISAHQKWRQEDPVLKPVWATVNRSLAGATSKTLSNLVSSSKMFRALKS